jgi:hypothetical protein
MPTLNTPRHFFGRCHQVTRSASLLLLMLAGSRAQDRSNGPVPGFTTHALRATADESMSPTWRVSGAELSENVALTEGAIVVQNAGELPASQARFYVEYYDAAGDLCLSLAFEGEANERNSRAPIVPGESRKLYSQAASLGPAAEPVEARVWMVSQVLGDKPGVGASDDVMHIPVTAQAPTTDSWLKLTLDLNDVKDAPVVDLALGQVWVDSEGNLQRFEILNARDETLRSWFQGFVARMVFRPAMLGFTQTAGSSLILVRALKDKIVEAGPVPLLTRQSGWLIGHNNRFGSGAPPPVMQLIFNRSPLITAMGPNAASYQARLNASVNEYQLGGLIGWSDGVLKWVQVGHTGKSVRQWMVPEDFSR